MNRPAIFLDRDGTLIEDREYIREPGQVALAPRAAEGLRAMRELGFPLYVISNQSGIARGILTERDLRAVNLRMIAVLAKEGATVDGMYFCPHHPEGSEPLYRVDCECRKPKPGLLHQAAGEHGLDPARSFLVGDSVRDLLAGRSVGSRTILVLTGNGRKTLGEGPTHPDADFIASDLMDAAGWIRQRIES